MSWNCVPTDSLTLNASLIETFRVDYFRERRAKKQGRLGNPRSLFYSKHGGEVLAKQAPGSACDDFQQLTFPEGLSDLGNCNIQQRILSRKNWTQSGPVGTNDHNSTNEERLTYFSQIKMILVLEALQVVYIKPRKLQLLSHLFKNHLPYFPKTWRELLCLTAKIPRQLSLWPLWEFKQTCLNMFSQALDGQVSMVRARLVFQ